ncbi:MAG: Asp-tRNA(Asn)/Glu-tRNA(Gln) amidotransferase subunit GatC [Chlamydiia bacterium]|nr:Asp-tRNA(Asn)/Glu-tRNA(Gln) amidotransferase subunit GatC [Chlamydiia bacterium]
MTFFDEETLVHLSKLCRIDCEGEELKDLLKNLQAILRYMEELKEIDTENVPVCNHVSEHVESFMRDDEVTETLDRETFLKNSPSQVGGMVRVPTVIKF